MVFPQAYTEMQLQASNRRNTDGKRPYPLQCMEIYMLQQAQQKAKMKEATVFSQLIDTFDWTLTRKQREDYLKAQNVGFTILLTDLSRTILWASHSFLSMTGYATTEAVGKTPMFLQGAGTSQETIEHIQEELRQARPVKADLINYRKSGESYVCRIAIDPLCNSRGEMTHFLAVESEVCA